MPDSNAPQTTPGPAGELTLGMETFVAIVAALEEYANAENWNDEHKRWMAGCWGDKIAAHTLRLPELQKLRERLKRRQSGVVRLVEHELESVHEIVRRVTAKRGLVKTVNIDVDQGEVTVQMRTGER